MKYQGKITDPKDLVTKEYVDPKAAIANPTLAGTEKKPARASGGEC